MPNWIIDAKAKWEQRLQEVELEFKKQIPETMLGFEQFMDEAKAQKLVVGYGHAKKRIFSKSNITYKCPGNFMSFMDGSEKYAFVIEWTLRVVEKDKWIQITLGVDETQNMKPVIEITDYSSSSITYPFYSTVEEAEEAIIKWIEKMFTW